LFWDIVMLIVKWNKKKCVKRPSQISMAKVH
jgi:hypothetical protein